MIASRPRLYSVSISAGEAIVFDPQRLHGLLNESDAPIRYIVILRP